MELTTNEIIKRARKSLGITQDKMSQLLNMRRSTYAYKELKGNFTFDEVKIVSEVLHLPLQAIADSTLTQHHFIVNDDTKTQQLQFEAPPPVYTAEDPLDGLITFNERLLLKGYRDLKPEDKEKLKAFLEQLKNAED